MKNSFFTKLILTYIKKFFYFFLDKKVDLGGGFGVENINRDKARIESGFVKNFLSSKKVYIFLDQQINFFLKRFFSKGDRKDDESVLYFKDKYGYIFYRDLNTISSTISNRYKLHDDDYVFWEKNSGLWQLLAFRKYDSWFFFLLSIYVFFELFLMVSFFNLIFGSNSIFDILLFLKDNFLIFSDEHMSFGKNRFYSFLLLYCLFWFFVELIFFFSDYVDEEETDMEKFGETVSGSLFIHTQPYRSPFLYLISSLYVLVLTFFFVFILMFIFYFFWIIFNVFLMPSIITFGVFFFHILNKTKNKLYKDESTRLSNYRRIKRRRFYHMNLRKFLIYQRMAQRSVISPFLESKGVSNLDNTFKKIKKYHFFKNQIDFLKSKRSLRDYPIPLNRKKIYLFSRSLTALLKKDYIKSQKQRFLESREKIQFPRYKTYVIKNPIVLNKLNFLKKFSYYYSKDRNYFGRIFSKMSGDMYQINANKRSLSETEDLESFFFKTIYEDRFSSGGLKRGDVLLNYLHIMERLHEVLYTYYAYPMKRNLSFKSNPYTIMCEYFVGHGSFESHFRLYGGLPYKLTTSTEESGYRDLRDKDLFRRYLSLFYFNKENLNKLFNQPSKSIRTFSNFEKHYLHFLEFLNSEKSRFVKFHPDVNPVFNDFSWYALEIDKHTKGDFWLDEEAEDHEHFLMNEGGFADVYHTYQNKPGHDSRYTNFLSFKSGANSRNLYFGLLDKNYTNRLFRQLRLKQILKRLLEETPRSVHARLNNFDLFLLKDKWLMKRSLLLRNKHMEKFRRKGTVRKFLDEEETLRNQHYTSIGSTGLFNLYKDKDSVIWNRLNKSYEKEFLNFDMKFGPDSNRYKWNFNEFETTHILYLITKSIFNHYFQYQFPRFLLKKGIYNDRRRAHFLNFYKEMDWDLSRVIFKWSLNRVYEDDIPMVSLRYMRNLRNKLSISNEFLLDLKKEGFRGKLSSLNKNEKLLLLNFLINKQDSNDIYTSFLDNKNLLSKVLVDSLGDDIDDKNFSYLFRHNEFYYNIMPYFSALFFDYEDENESHFSDDEKVIEAFSDEVSDRRLLEKEDMTYGDLSTDLGFFEDNSLRNSSLLRYLDDQDLFFRNNLLKVSGGSSFLKKYSGLKNLKIRPFYYLVNENNEDKKGRLFFWERYRNLVYLENIFLEFFRKRKQNFFKKMNKKSFLNTKELLKLNSSFNMDDDIFYSDDDPLILDYFKFVFFFCKDSKLSLYQYVYLVKKLMMAKSFFVSFEDYFLYFRFILSKLSALGSNLDLEYCFNIFEKILYHEKVLKEEKNLEIVSFTEEFFLKFHKRFDDFFTNGSGYLDEMKYDRFRNFFKRYQKSKQVLHNEDHKLFSSLFSIFSLYSSGFNKFFYDGISKNNLPFSDSESILREKYLFLLNKFFKESGLVFFLRDNKDFFRHLEGLLGLKSYSILHFRKRKILKPLYQKFLVWRKWKNFRNKKLNMNFIQSKKRILSKYFFLSQRIDRDREMDLTTLTGRYTPIGFDLQTSGWVFRNPRIGIRSDANVKDNFIFFANRFLNQRINGSPLVDLVKGQRYGGKRWRNFLMGKFVLGFGRTAEMLSGSSFDSFYDAKQKHFFSFAIDKILDVDVPDVRSNLSKLKSEFFKEIICLSKLVRHPVRQTYSTRKKILKKYRFLQRMTELEQLNEGLNLLTKGNPLNSFVVPYFLHKLELMKFALQEIFYDDSGVLKSYDFGHYYTQLYNSFYKVFMFSEWIKSSVLNITGSLNSFSTFENLLERSFGTLDEDDDDEKAELVDFFLERFEDKSLFDDSNSSLISKDMLRYLSKNSSSLFPRSFFLADNVFFRKWFNKAVGFFLWDNELSYLKNSGEDDVLLMKYPYFFFNFEKNNSLSKNSSVFFEKRSIKNKRWLFLKNGRNLGFNFQQKISAYDKLGLKRNFFFNISEYIIKSVLLKSLIYHKSVGLKLPEDSLLSMRDLYNMLLRKYISFLYLNLLKKHSLSYKNGKLSDLFLFLKLNKMEKDKDNMHYNFYEFPSLQKIKIPFYRFLYWLNRKQEFDDFLLNKLKKNRNLTVNKDFFDIYYPSILTQRIFKRKNFIKLKQADLKSWSGWYYWLVRNFKNPLFSNYYMEFRNSKWINSFLTGKQKNFIKNFLILRRHNLGYSFDRKLGEYTSKFWGEDYSNTQDMFWGTSRVFYRKVNQDMFYLSQYIDALLYIFRKKNLYSKHDLFTEKFSRWLVWDLNENNKFLGALVNIPNSSNFVDISLLMRLYYKFLRPYRKYSRGEFGDGGSYFPLDKKKDVYKILDEKRRRFFSLLLEKTLFKYFETTYNISKRDSIFLRNKFMLLKKYYKYSFILNNILENNNVNRNNVTSFQTFFLDWKQGNNFFFIKKKKNRFSLLYRNLFNNFFSRLYDSSSLSNFIYLKNRLRNIDNVLVNSANKQLGVETMPRYVGKNLREKLYDWQQKEMFSEELNFVNFLKKLGLKRKITLADKLFLFRRISYFPDRKFLESKRQYKINEVKNYSKFSDSVKDPLSYYFRGSGIDKAKRYRKEFWNFGRNYAMDELKYNFFNKNRKFYSDRENIVFYSFLDKEYGKKFLWLFDKVGKKYSNISTNVRGEFPLNLKVRRKNKNSSFDMFYFWRTIKLLHKFETNKSFLNWIKRKYGNSLLKNFDKTSFLWKYNVLFDSSNSKFDNISKVPIKRFLEQGADGEKVFLDSKAAYANGKIRVPYTRLRDFYFLNRQRILRLLRKSLFAFKATTGFLFYNYNIKGWHDRLINHVKDDDRSLFLDVVLEEEIISKTNDIFIPSFWFFRFPYSDIFSKFFTNSLFDVSLDVSGVSGVVMRMQTFLNNFNSSNIISLYPNGPLNAVTTVSNFVDSLKYPYNAFFNFEKQFLDMSSSLNNGVYNNSVMIKERIFDLLLAEKIRVISYHKMLKYIKQYDNLVFTRKVERFSSLDNVFSQGENFRSYSNYLDFFSCLNKIEPFFFSNNNRFFIKSSESLFMKNFSFIDHNLNLSFLQNVISFPSTVSISSNFLNYIHFSKNFILRKYLDDFNCSIIKFLFFKFDESILFMLNLLKTLPSYFFLLLRLDWLFYYNFFDFILYFFFIYFPLIILFFLVIFYKHWFLGTNQASKKYVEDGDGKFSLKENFSLDDSQLLNPYIPYKVDQNSNSVLYNSLRVRGAFKNKEKKLFAPTYNDYDINFRRKFARFYRLSYLAQLRFSKQNVFGKKQKVFLKRYSDFINYSNTRKTLLKDLKRGKVVANADKFVKRKVRLKSKKKTKLNFNVKAGVKKNKRRLREKIFVKKKLTRKRDYSGLNNRLIQEYFVNTRKHNFFFYDSFRVHHMFYGDWFFRRVGVFKPTQRFLRSSLFLKKKLRNMLISYRKSFFNVRDFIIRQKLAKHYFNKDSVSFSENDFSLNFGPSEWYSLKFEFLVENSFFVNLKNYYNSCFDLPSWSTLRMFDLFFLKFFHRNKVYCSNLDFNKNMYLRYKHTFYKAICTYRNDSVTNWSYFFSSYSDAFVDDVFSGVFSSGNFLDFFYLKEHPNYISLYKNGLLIYRFDKLSLFSSRFNLYSKSSLYMLKGTKRSPINFRRFFKDATDIWNEEKKRGSKFDIKKMGSEDEIEKEIKKKTKKGRSKDGTKKDNKDEKIIKLNSYYDFSSYTSKKYINRLTWSGKRRNLGQKNLSGRSNSYFEASLSEQRRRFDNYRYVKRYYYDFYEKNQFLKYLEDNYRVRKIAFWWSEGFYFFIRVCFVVLFFFIVFLLLFKFFFIFFQFLLSFKNFIFSFIK